MNVIKALALTGCGLWIVYGAASELMYWLRSRSRLLRTVGVIVRTRDAGAHLDPGLVGRSGILRFTTRDGRQIEAASSAYVFRGPKIGTRVTVIYDPDDPRGTAERLTVVKLKIGFAVPLMTFGLALALFGLTLL